MSGFTPFDPNSSGGGTGSGDGSFFFASEGDRDAFFTITENRALLVKDLPITTTNGDGDVENQQWKGTDNPLAYGGENWIVASISTGPGTLTVGSIAMKGAGENFTFSNNTDGDIFYPVWVDSTTGIPAARKTIGNHIDIIIEPSKADILIDPAFDFSTIANSRLQDITLEVDTTITNVVAELRRNGVLFYSAKLGTLVANVETEVALDDSTGNTFADAFEGVMYEFSFSSFDGDVRCKGSTVNALPWAKIGFQEFIDNQVTVQDEADQRQIIRSGVKGNFSVTAINANTDLQITADAGAGSFKCHFSGSDVIDSLDGSEIDVPDQVTAVSSATGVVRRYVLITPNGIISNTATKTTIDNPNGVHLFEYVSVDGVVVPTSIVVNPRLSWADLTMQGLMESVGIQIDDLTVSSTDDSTLGLSTTEFNETANSINYINSKRNPHVLFVPSADPQSWTYVDTGQVAVPPIGADNLLDPTQYDNAGVLTAVGPNQASVQLLLVNQSNFVLLFGQQIFPNYDDALLNMDAISFDIPDVLSGAVPVSRIALKGNATDSADDQEVTIRNLIGATGSGTTAIGSTNFEIVTTDLTLTEEIENVYADASLNDVVLTLADNPSIGAHKLIWIGDTTNQIILRTANPTFPISDIPIIAEPNVQGLWAFSGDFLDRFTTGRDLTNLGFGGSFIADTVNGTAVTVFDTEGTAELTAAGYKGILGNQLRSWTGWIGFNGLPTEDQYLVSWGSDNSAGQSWLLFYDFSNLEIRMSIKNANRTWGLTELNAVNFFDGNMHHLALSQTGTGAANSKLYIDGVEIANKSGDNSPAMNTQSEFDYGISKSLTGSNPLNARLYDVRLFDKGLSPLEVITIRDDDITGSINLQAADVNMVFDVVFNGAGWVVSFGDALRLLDLDSRVNAIEEVLLPPPILINWATLNAEAFAEKGTFPDDQGIWVQQNFTGQPAAIQVEPDGTKYWGIVGGAGNSWAFTTEATLEDHQSLFDNGGSIGMLIAPDTGGTPGQEMSMFMAVTDARATAVGYVGLGFRFSCDVSILGNGNLGIDTLALVSTFDTGILWDDYLDIRMYISPDFSQADVIVNGVSVFLNWPRQVGDTNNAARFIMFQQLSNFKVKRIGLTYLEEPESKLFELDSFSSGLITFPDVAGANGELRVKDDILPSPIGTTVDLLLNNVGGTFTVRNVEALNPTVTTATPALISQISGSNQIISDIDIEVVSTVTAKATFITDSNFALFEIEEVIEDSDQLTIKYEGVLSSTTLALLKDRDGLSLRHKGASKRIVGIQAAIAELDTGAPQPIIGMRINNAVVDTPTAMVGQDNPVTLPLLSANTIINDGDTIEIEVTAGGNGDAVNLIVYMELQQ